MSKRSRQSRLFNSQPDLLLVEEYPSIVLPNAAVLRRSAVDDLLSHEFIEVSEEDDDTDEDDVEVTARIFISSPRVPAGPPVGRSVSAVQAAMSPRLGRPRQLGTPRIVAGFNHPEDLPSPAYVDSQPAVEALEANESESDWGDEGWDEEGDTGSWDNGEWDTRLNRDPASRRAQMDDSDDSDDDSDEDFNRRPEPLRLALPQAAGQEASLILAAGAVEDFDEDWDDEDDWSEELSEEEEEEDNESIRLSLGSNSSLDFLRDLEERRSFKAPIWGPRPNSTGFDPDISLYEESEEDVSHYEAPEEDVAAFDDFEDTSSEADDLVRFEDDSEPRGMAAVRVGAPIGFGSPRQLNSDSDAGDASDESDGDDDLAFGMPRFQAQDPLRAPRPRTGWSEESSDEEEEETPRAWSDLSGMADDPVKTFITGRRGEDSAAKSAEAVSRPTSRESAPTRRAASPPSTPPQNGIHPAVSAAAIILLVLSAGALIWVQFHEELGLPFPTVDSESAGLDLPEEPVFVGPMLPDPEIQIPEEPVVDPEPPEEPPVVEAPEVITGKLMVTSNRRSAVFINKTKIGITPLEGPLDLEAGTYEVSATALKTGKKQRLQARVDAGKVLQVTFEFR